MVKRQCMWSTFLNMLLISIMRIETPEVSTIKKIVVLAATLSATGNDSLIEIATS